MNIKRTFKSAYAKIEPGKGFNEKTIQLMRQVNPLRAGSTTSGTGRRAWLMTTLKFCANILVILLVVHLTGIGNAFLPAMGGIPTTGPSATQTAASTTDTAPAATTASTMAIAIGDIVVSRDYPQGELVDYRSPKPGEVIIYRGVKLALEEAANQGKFFYVELMIVPSENEIARLDHYVYNGRTVAEWRELVDLANGTYPYSEYNGDHGGQVTVEAWRQKQAEAKTLDAQANLDQATDQFNVTVRPGNRQKTQDILLAEATRLTGLGCQVFIRQIKSEGHGLPNDEYSLLCGLLTASQLRDFPAPAEYGYAIEWVHEDGRIVNSGD